MIFTARSLNSLETQSTLSFLFFSFLLRGQKGKDYIPAGILICQLKKNATKWLDVFDLPSSQRQIKRKFTLCDLYVFAVKRSVP
jgi:hypothetical protein